MIKAVIFDLDGTLLNTLDDLAAAGNYALRQYDLPEHPVEAYRYFVGNGIPKLIQRILPKDTDAVLMEQVHNTFLQYYGEHKEDQTRPYPGIMEMLDSMIEKGIKLAVVTNKDDTPAQAIMHHYFGDRFSVVMGRIEGIAPKPNPTLVWEAMNKLHVAAEETLYVGDSDVDMETAKNAGLTACGVLWGFREQEELLAAGADCLAEQANEIKELCMDL